MMTGSFLARCANCRRVIAEVTQDGTMISRKRGREIYVKPDFDSGCSVNIVCGDCGTTNRFRMQNNGGTTYTTCEKEKTFFPSK